MVLSVACRQLIVEASFAALNHGLFAQAKSIAIAFPDIVLDVNLCAICEAIVLFGCDQPAAAIQKLAHNPLTEAATLRQLFQTALAEK